MLMMVEVARPVLAWVLVELLGPRPIGIAWILCVQIKSAFDMFAGMVRFIAIKAKHQSEPDVDEVQKKEAGAKGKKTFASSTKAKAFEWPKMNPIEFRWPHAKPIDWKWKAPSLTWNKKTK